MSTLPTRPERATSGALRRVEDALAYVAGGAILLIMVVTIIDVVGRAFFRQPLFGAYETIEGFLLGFVVWLGLSQGARLDQHIAVNVVAQRFSERTQKLMTVIPLLATVAVFGFIAVATLGRAIDRWSAVTESTVVPLPNGLAWLGVGVGSAVIAVRVATTFFVDVQEVFFPTASQEETDE